MVRVFPSEFSLFKLISFLKEDSYSCFLFFFLKDRTCITLFPEKINIPTDKWGKAIRINCRYMTRRVGKRIQIPDQ